MNASNPYEPPSTKPEDSSWRPFDFFVAGIWLAIPVGVLFGRMFLLPVFDDFGVTLPSFTQYLLRPYSPVPFTIVSLLVLLVLFSIPHGSLRRRLMWLASITGTLVVLGCLLAFLVPLISLAQNLT